MGQDTSYFDSGARLTDPGVVGFSTHLVHRVEGRRYVNLHPCCLSVLTSTVDDLPFWLYFYQHYDRSAPILALPERRSTAQVIPTPYSCARRWFYRVCAACHINIPNKPLQSVAIDLDEFVYVDKLGRLPMCLHHTTLCQGCATEAIPHRTNMRWHVGNSVTNVVDDDVDGFGNVVECDSALCHPCRLGAIKYQFRRLLARNARGGPVRGLRNPYTEHEELSGYVVSSDELSSNAAARTLETAFYTDAVADHWNTLVAAACRLQELEDMARVQYQSGLGDEFDVNRNERFRLHNELLPLAPLTLEADYFQRRKLERVWNHEVYTYGVNVDIEEVLDYDDLNGRVSFVLRNTVMCRSITDA